MYLPQILTLALQMTQYIALTRFFRETSKKVNREARKKSEKIQEQVRHLPPAPLRLAEKYFRVQCDNLAIIGISRFNHKTGGRKALIWPSLMRSRPTSKQLSLLPTQLISSILKICRKLISSILKIESSSQVFLKQKFHLKYSLTQTRTRTNARTKRIYRVVFTLFRPKND